MRLEGKRAIVTGAGSGFGEGIAKKFVAEGARVVVADRDGDAALRVAARLGAVALGLRADVTVTADVRAIVAAAHDHFGVSTFSSTTPACTTRRSRLRNWPKIASSASSPST